MLSYLYMLHLHHPVPSAPPRSLSVDPLTPQRLSVSWRAPPQDQQNGEIRYYTIRLVELAVGSVREYNTSDSSTHWSVDSLQPYNRYNVSVAAATVGLGPFNNEISIRMPEAGE